MDPHKRWDASRLREGSETPQKLHAPVPQLSSSPLIKQQRAVFIRCLRVRLSFKYAFIIACSQPFIDLLGLSKILKKWQSSDQCKWDGINGRIQSQMWHASLAPGFKKNKLKYLHANATHDTGAKKKSSRALWLWYWKWMQIGYHTYIIIYTHVCKHVLYWYVLWIHQNTVCKGNQCKRFNRWTVICWEITSN